MWTLGLHRRSAAGACRGAARGWRHALLVATVLALASACSSGSESFPVACQDSPDAFARALTAAPRPVLVDGTRISSCFARRSDPGSIETLASTLIAVDAALADRARLAPSSHAAVELGYLLGAARRGAARTEGIHLELLRRLRQELVGLDTTTAAYASGEQAGERTG